MERYESSMGSPSAQGAVANTRPWPEPSESKAVQEPTPFDWWRKIRSHCLEYARTAKEHGHPVVGVLCQFTPRELIMAAGAVPVGICSNSLPSDSAGQRELPTNLCPLIKSAYGNHSLGDNPFLEMSDLVVAEATCDGRKKLYDLMSRARAVHVLELPQNVQLPEARRLWERELHRLRAHLEERFDIVITPDLLGKSIAVMNRERSYRRRLAELMKADDPPITGRQLLLMRCGICGIKGAFQQYERVLEWARGRAGVGHSRTRVLLTGVPVAFGAEAVVDVIENNGGLVVCMENCTGLKPVLEDVAENTADPIAALAEKYLHLPCAVMTGSDRRISNLRELVRQYRPECVVELVWQACTNYQMEGLRVRQLVEEELDLPYLRLETDRAASDSAGITAQLQALFEAVRDRAGAKGR